MFNTALDFIFYDVDGARNARQERRVDAGSGRKGSACVSTVHARSEQGGDANN
jgi:hypothetical protein